MIADSTKELHTASSRDEGFRLPSPMTHGTGDLLTPVTTTPLMENAPAAQATMMVPCGWRHHSQKKASLMSDIMLITGGSNRKHILGSPPSKKRHCPSEASSTVSKPLPWYNRMRCHGMSAHSRQRGSCWWTSPPHKLEPRRWIPLPVMRGLGCRHRSKAPECFTSSPYRHGGQDVPPTCGDSRHCHHATSGVCPLASV
jgi:hypothetical protein